MSKLEEFQKHIYAGSVYRRSDLERWSTSVDRHLRVLLQAGVLQKLSSGLYYCPTKSAYGALPPEDKDLVRAFLKDDYFLLSTPNDYNNLGVGTTQLYNKRVVYNHKRHGEFKLGNKTFHFQIKRFPKSVTTEFLLVDLVNNLDTLAEDQELVIKNVVVKAKELDQKRLKRSVKEYGTVRTRKLFTPLLNGATV